MKKVSTFVKSQYFLLFTLATINLLIVFTFLAHPVKLNGDAPTYLAAMQFLQDKEVDQKLCGEETDMLVKARILTTPLMLYSSIFFSKFTGSEYNGMFLVNIIFYFLIIYVFYELVYLIYKNSKIALLSSILFFGNYCLYHYGTTYRTDIGGWFFFLLTTLLAVKYFKNPESNKFYYLAILSASIGVLFKEYGALGMIPLGILILFLPNNFFSKVFKILKAAFLFLIIPGLYHLFIYLQYGFSYLDWHSYAFNEVINNPATPGIDWSILLLVKVLGWLFLAGWPIFAWGLYQEYKNFDKQRVKILLAILPASLSFLAWPGLTQRIAFILVPWLVMISGYGLSKIKSKYLIVFILLIYALVNYLTRPWLLSMINL